MALFYIVKSMYEDDGRLSPDLEWMLQSYQVDIDSLIEILVASYYQHLYMLALSRLSYPEEAHRVAQDTIIQAISQKKDFRGKTSVIAWVEAIAFGIIAERKLNQEHLRFLNQNLINSIHTRQKDNTLPKHQLQLATAEIKSQLHAKRFSSSKWARFQILGMTGITILIVYFLFTFRSVLVAGVPVENTSASTANSNSMPSDVDIPLPYRDLPISADNARERSIIAASLTPLSIDSSSQEIKERILSSSKMWNTMWADIVVRFNGPEGYLGPPHTERHQLWIDQVGGAFLIIGPVQGIPDSIEKIILSPGTSPTQLGLFGATDYAKLGSQYPWFSIKTETLFLYPFAMNYLFQTLDQDILQEADFSVIGEDVVADREALIVELASPEGNTLARFWLDNQIGIVLKEQYYDPSEYAKVIIESGLRKIRFDDSIPSRRKKQEKSTPAPIEVLPGISGLPGQSSSMAMEYPMLGFPFRSPPSNFDLPHSRISFAKADHTDLDRTESGKFHIFADNFHLGEIEMIDPLKVICDRSPDGSKLVFADWRIFPTDINDKIYWLDLQDLNLVSLDIPNTIIFWISFSPDNRFIVVTGYDGLDGKEKFYLFDTTSGDYELLPIRAGYGSVAWSPDGAQIAVLDWSILPSIPGSKTRIRVYDSQNGENIDNIITDGIPRERTSIKIPLNGWTADFQIPLQELSHCTS
jgi:hypothetical protein